jgi:U3 small nucleolar RNA-associated protein 7
LEGEDGEDTAKIRQADIVEAVDIASAAKVSLREGVIMG